MNGEANSLPTLDEWKARAEQAEARAAAAVHVATCAIQANLTAAKTARQVLDILIEANAGPRAYQGAIEQLAVLLESYTPPEHQPTP